MLTLVAVVLGVGGAVMQESGGAEYRLQAIDPESVELGGEIGRRVDITVNNNLLVIDVDGGFLKPFQERTSTSGFVGLGMLIDAMARIAYHTGNEDLIARKDHVVAQAIAAQQPDGYLGMMREESRIRELWDVHEMSYLVLGLSTDYSLFGNQPSLDAAKRLADYLITRLDARPIEKNMTTDLSPAMPITGLADAFLELTGAGGGPQYRQFCLDALDMPNWRKPIVKGRFGAIDGHVYAYIDKCLVQLRLDAGRNDAGLHSETNKVLDFILRGEGLTISGACGDHECWNDAQSGMNNLGETCASAYMLKFYDELLRQTGDSLYGDLMERTICNALFSAQSPDGRQIRYYTPFEAKRVYFDTDTYCCPNNYRRGIGDLPGFVVYTDETGIRINLYTESSVRAALPNGAAVMIRQETAYPTEGRVAIHVEPASKQRFTLALRMPRWCPDPEVRVNGEKTEAPCAPGSWCAIDREWEGSDIVEVEFPMSWRFVKGRRSQIGRVAIMRGPQIFGLSPSRNEGMEGIEPRLLTMDPDTFEGPTPDDSVHPGGLACAVSVWDPGVWYPGGAQRQITLTEYADPGLELIYFHVPNPEDERFADDELFPPEK